MVYLRKKTNNTPTIAQNCPNIKANVHFTIWDSVSAIFISIYETLFSNLSSDLSNIVYSDFVVALSSNSTSASAHLSESFSRRIFGIAITSISSSFIILNIDRSCQPYYIFVYNDREHQRRWIKNVVKLCLAKANIENQFVLNKFGDISILARRCLRWY